MKPRIKPIICLKVTLSLIQKYAMTIVLKAVVAFNKLGYKRQIPLIYEELVDQPIWLNPNIRDTLGRSFHFSEFTKDHHITYNHTYHLGELFSNYTKPNRNHIITKPIVGQGHLLTPYELNAKYESNIPLNEWQTLLDAIPPTWIHTISRGNQSLIDEAEQGKNGAS